MDKPCISIITVVFNNANVLEQTILSVVNQNYLNIEYIIIDGGSIDGTVDIIKKYQDKVKYWISEPDRGVYDAMNKGLMAVTGEWVYFINAGDILINIIDKIIPLFTEANSIYYGDVYKLDELKLYDGWFSPFKLAVSNICHQAIFYPSKVFEKYNFNLRYKILADHNLNMEIYGDKQYKFRYIPVQISVYEGGGYSALNPVDTEFFLERLRIIRSNFPLPVYWYAAIRSALAKFKTASSK